MSSASTGNISRFEAVRDFFRIIAVRKTRLFLRVRTHLSRQGYTESKDETVGCSLVVVVQGDVDDRIQNVYSFRAFVVL
jgi:hypothetical protein